MGEKQEISGLDEGATGLITLNRGKALIAAVVLFSALGYFAYLTLWGFFDSFWAGGSWFLDLS